MKSVRIVLAAWVIACLVACGGEKEPKVAPAIPEAQNLPGKPGGKGVKVGVVLPLTGAYKVYAEEVRDGIEAALEDLGATPMRERIKLDVRDCAGDAQQAKQAYKDLVGAGAVAVIGAVDPASTIALAEASAAEAAAVVSPVCTAAGIESRSANFVRLAITENLEAAAMARHAREQLKVQLVAIYEDATAEGQSLGRNFAKEFERQGGKVVWRETYIPEAGDYRFRLRAAKTRKPQALFVTGLMPELAEICRQAREIGLTQPILGGVTWDQPTPAADLDHIYYVSQYAPGLGGPKAAALSNILVGKRKTANEYNALAFDAMLLVAHAVDTAEKLDAASVAKALAASKDVPGATGMLAAVEANKPFYIISVANGKKSVAKNLSLQTP